ncbi:hypothetical protein R5R35_009644 [Gryllus longicercus]|uniref:Sorting nexin 14 n=1 Tax=Gryllus longicercus TaxID=2509291 RepID=A0AAN9V7U8_9ORTH
MDQAQIKTVIFLLWNDRLSRTCALSVLVVSLFLTVSLSLLSGIIVLGTYVGGFFAFSTIFSYRSEAPNLLSLLIGKQRCNSSSSQHKQCHVCGDGKCNRHQPKSNSQQPWVDLDVPEELDEAIEDFLNKILDEFIYTWYRQLSADENFVLELRLSIRHAASALLRRGLQLDLAHVITNKLIPAGLSHLDDYLGSLRLSRKQHLPIDRAALQYLGPRLHPAARNRENELEYLRKLTSLLMPQLLPAHQLACRNYSTLVREILAGWVLLPLVDVLADPSIVNSLLLLLLERNTLTEYPNTSPSRVEFLARFVSVPVSRNSALRLDISGVLKDQELLYPFMQFLKGEGYVNVLQFCLDVEEFNRKMLVPELNSQDLDNLYKEAWDLYSVYFSPKSPDRIPFNSAVVQEMHTILQEPAENIVKLRTTPPLFQAYEYAFSQLENVLGPLFHQSDDYFTLLCGQRLPTGYSKSGSSSPMLQGSPAKGRSSKKWNEGGAVARLSSRLHKIKGVLRTQPVEGHTYDVTDVTDPGLDLGETDFAEDLPIEEATTYRDLSAWRVSIPSVETRQDINSKAVPVYIINVQRIDVRSEDDPESYHWVVERKYNDFYVLESKLTEFHGEFDIHLPPKRILFGPRGVEFMESKRLYFEDFLQRLLQKPNLRGSDLLYSFLRSPAEFVPASGGIAAVPEGLGRMIRRSVPLRLRKERGQHLDTFLSTFLTSTEGGRGNKNTKFEWKDVATDTPRRIRCLTKGIYGDNFGVPSNQLLFAISGTTVMNVPIQGIFDCILYLTVKVFGAPPTFVRLALAIRAMAHNTVNALCWFYLDRKLKKLLVAPRLAHLVRLLQGVIFSPKGNPPTAQDFAARAARTQTLLQGLLPHWLTRWAGSKYTEGIQTLFSAVQNPALNKQLVYILLDTLAVELYSDVVTGDRLPSTEK